ncbi:MAG TPA: acyl-CoA dehydrogenase family protein, partial [Ilumatobacteraceae bacterium]|nr:acyl-CoA dehydrogenase family protein [Ilumatobacteraceae bacterium]
ADGDSWIISGTKCWITNAGISDLYTVFARTSPDRHKGITAFLVEAEWGVQVDKLEHKLGIKGSPTGVIRLDEVRVPDANRIGEVGEGFAAAMHTLDRSRPTIGAQAVGVAQGALDYAVGYMKERRTFGRPLAENQGLQWMAADCAMKIEASRALVYRACAIADDGDPHGELGMAGAMAKCFASDTAMQVTTDAVQFVGGYGYTNEFPVERMMRDAKITQIYEGTNQIQRMVIAKKLFS